MPAVSNLAVRAAPDSLLGMSTAQYSQCFYTDIPPLKGTTKHFQGDQMGGTKPAEVYIPTLVQQEAI